MTLTETPAPAGGDRLARRRRNKHGFTLIELMVVLLIIAILLAVAIPTYLSARDRAENRAAQITLHHVFLEADAEYASQGSFDPPGGGLLAAYLDRNDPDIGVTDLQPSSSTLIRDAISRTNAVNEEHSSQSLALAAWAPDGRCFDLLDIASPNSNVFGVGSVAGVDAIGVWVGESEATDPRDPIKCDAQYRPPGSGWHRSWAAAAKALG